MFDRKFVALVAIFGALTLSPAGAAQASSVSAPVQGASLFPESCRNQQVAGGLIGGIIGGVLGSNASNRNQNRNTAIGAIVGGLIGSQAARYISRCEDELSANIAREAFINDKDISVPSGEHYRAMYTVRGDSFTDNGGRHCRYTAVNVTNGDNDYEHLVCANPAGVNPPVEIVSSRRIANSA